MAVKDDYVRTLVDAYYQYDEDRFRRTVLQIAAQAKNERFKESILRRAEVVRPVLTTGQQNFVESVARVETGALVLERALDQSLFDVVREHRAHMELLVRGVEPRRRLIFEGAPGNGKTSAAAWLAGELNLSCFAVSVAKIVGSHLGETAGHLASLFPALSAGVCLMLDEIDALAAKRGASDSGAMREFNLTVNALLSLLDRTPGGLLIATTNRADILDPAIFRRFDDVLTFPEPNTTQVFLLRDKLVERYQIKSFTVDESKAMEAAKSFAEVERVCRKAARREAVAEHEAKAVE